jgi:NarL family two-component system response regulator LiaR
MSHKRPIRVLIADDHLMVREGLRVFLSDYDDIEVVGEAQDGQEAVTRCEQLRPDVVLMDMVMPEMDGPQAIKQILQASPQVKAIAITSFEDRGLVARAVKAGAVAYLYKDVHADKLVRAIRDADDGLGTIDAAAAQALLTTTHDTPLLGHDLTAREKEVLALLIHGMTNSAIGRHLTISEATVRLHVSNVIGKLGASNRTEAVSLALKHKLL